MGEFVYREISSNTFGILVAAPPAIPAPERDEEVISIPGRDGVMRIDGGRYKPIKISYEIGFICDKGKVADRASAINAWLLAGRGDYRLEDTYDMDYFRIASYSGPHDIANIFKRAGKATIIFQCHPYKYAKSGVDAFEIDAPGAVYNPEMFESYPYFKIYGNGSGDVYLNNTTIHLQNIDDYIEVDSESKQIFKGIALKSKDVILGDFPTFEPGENQLDWSGGITTIEIIPRWRTL